MSRLRNKVLPVLAVSSLPSSHITSGPDISWTKVGSGKDHLLSELESLYWDGVRTELENIVRTLKVWQQPEYAQVTIQDEDDDHVHGFDTFLDQVSHEARAHAIRYGQYLVPDNCVFLLLTYKGEMREKQTKKKKDWYPNTKPFGTKFARDAVLDSISDRIAQQVSDGIKIDVRRELKGTILNLLFDTILTLTI